MMPFQVRHRIVYEPRPFKVTHADIALETQQLADRSIPMTMINTGLFLLIRHRVLANRASSLLRDQHFIPSSRCHSIPPP
jgi:hypothetical protein